MSSNSDRNLLFGILAVQMDFVARDALIEGMNAWVLDKSRPIEQILVDMGFLTETRKRMLLPLVEEHIRQHGGDPHQSLAALSSIASLDVELRRVADTELTTSLVHLQPGVNESDATITPAFRPEQLSTSRRFSIIRPHARGGLGEVYVARDEELGREVALKEIHKQHAPNADSRDRFVREAEITGGLEHPGIVPVYGLGHYEDGRPYYAMRFIRGASLKEALDEFHAKAFASEWERNLKLRELLGRFIDVCNAIEYAHSRGVLHRDLKPGNIMLGKYGETLVVDWGLAKVVGRDDDHHNDAESTLSIASASGSAATVLGSAIGTPAFMSPEQAEGKLNTLGPATDVYSLGATLYTLLVGKPPFEGDVIEVLERVKRGEFVRPDVADRRVPQSLSAICVKALAREPSERYSSCAELARDIERWLADEEVSAARDPFLVRVFRWARRHRTLTASAAALLLTTIVALSVSTVLIGREQRRTEAQRQSAEGAREDAQRNFEHAEEQRILAERSQQEAASQRERAAKARADSEANARLATQRAKDRKRQRYTNDVGLAHSEWEAGNVGLAESLLEEAPYDLRGWEWDHVRALCRQELYRVDPHTSEVQSVAFSPDGQRGVSTSFGQALVWDAQSGSVLLTLSGNHKRWILRATFSPDGKLLVTVGDNGIVTIWNAHSGEALRELHGHDQNVVRDAGTGATIRQLQSHEQIAEDVAFGSKDRMATVGRDRTMRLWDVSTGQEVKRFYNERHIRSIGFGAEGRQLYAAGEGGLIDCWDTATGNKQESLVTSLGGIERVAISRDGKWLAAASLDSAIEVWNLEENNRHSVLRDLDGPVTSVAFLPDGKQLVAGFKDNTLSLWDTETGAKIRMFRGHQDAIKDVAVSPDGSRIASASADRTAKVWSVSGGREVTRYAGHRDRVLSVVVSPNGRWVASAGDDRSLKVWNRFSGELCLNLVGHNERIHRLKFSPDGRQLASAGADDVAMLWDTATGEQIGALIGHQGDVLDIAFDPTGKQVATIGGDKRLKIWDARTFKLTRDIPSPNQLPLTALAWSTDGARLFVGSLVVNPGGNNAGVLLTLGPSGSLLALPRPVHSDKVTEIALGPDPGVIATASVDHTARVFRLETNVWNQLAEFPHHGVVESVAFLPDGERLVTASKDGGVQVWDIESRQAMLSLRDKLDDLKSIACSPDGRSLVAGSGRGRLQAWNTPPVLKTQTLSGHTYWVTGVAFSPDGRSLVSTSPDTTARIWDLTGEQDPKLLLGHATHVVRAAFSPSGNQIATAGGAGARLWEAATGKQLFELKSSDVTGTIIDVSYSPDERRIAVTGTDAKIRIWNIENGQLVKTIESADGFPRRIVYCPDGARIAGACTNSSTLVVWSSESGEVLIRKKASARITAVAVSANGRLLALGGLDGTVGIWRADDGEEIRVLKGFQAPVTDVCFGRTDERVAASGVDRSVRVWDTGSGKETNVFRGHADPVDAVAFSPDGALIASAGHDRQVKLWPADADHADWNLAVETVERLRNQLVVRERTIEAIQASTGSHATCLEIAEQFCLSQEEARLSLLNRVRTPGLDPVAYKQARRDAEVLNERFPADAELRDALAWSYYRTGDLARALTVATATKDSASALALSVLASYDLGQLKQATEFDLQLRRSDQVAQRDNKPGVERALFDEIDGKFNTRLQPIWAAKDQKDWKAVVEKTARQVDDGFHQMDVYWYAGMAHANLGQWTEAAADRAAQIELGNKHPYILFELALFNYAAGNEIAYRDACQKLVNDHRDARDVPIAVACVLSANSVEDFEPVVALAKRAAETQQANPLYSLGYGAALYRAGRVDEAIKTLEAAEARGVIAMLAMSSERDGIRFGQALARLFLGLAYDRKGDKSASEKAFNTSRTLTKGLQQAQSQAELKTSIDMWTVRMGLSYLDSQLSAHWPSEKSASETGSTGDISFVPLFPDDGIPAGWRVRHWSNVKDPPPEGAAWKVEEGVLHGSDPRGTWLVSEREYGDFVLELEFKLGERGNSGVGLRFPDAGDPAFDGLELQIVDPRYYGSATVGPTELTGSLYMAIAPSEQIYRPAEWNRYEITCRGSQVTVMLNDKRIQNVDLDKQTEKLAGSTALKDRPRRGHIGFQELSRGGGRVEIRNARIKVLQ